MSSEASTRPTDRPAYEREWEIFESQWIDPVAEDQELTTFQLYPQPSRGKGAKGSFQLYLPPTYEAQPDARFPVIYWLHGGRENSRSGAGAVRRIDAAIRAGAMPAALVVVPQVLPIGWYVDSKDGERPLEQIVVSDLIGHVDAHYRTVNDRSGRWIEGFSMGGYGALRFGFKYPKLFSRVSAIGPSVLRDMDEEPVQRTARTFAGDHAYYEAVGPWTLAVANAPEIAAHSTVRLLAGLEDSRLLQAGRDLSALMTSVGIEHEVHEVEGVAHDYEGIIDGIGGDYAAFWSDR